jgi:hypothetical protein
MIGLMTCLTIGLSLDHCSLIGLFLSYCCLFRTMD